MDLVAEKQWDERVDFCERHREYYMYDQECSSCLQEEDAAYEARRDDLERFGLAGEWEGFIL